MKMFWKTGLILCLMVLAIGLGAQTEDIDFKELTITTGFKRHELNEYLGDHRVATPLEEGGFAIMWQHGYTNLYLNFINRDGEKSLKEPYHIEIEEGCVWRRCFLEGDHEGGVYLIYSYENDKKGRCYFYINRINSEGKVLWGDRGVEITVADNSDHFHTAGGCLGTALSDKDGITVFTHDGADRSCVNLSRIYVQRFNLDGEAQMKGTGNVICKSPGTKCGMLAVDDGEGGIVLVWDEDLNGIRDLYGDTHMRAQRVDEKFKPKWKGKKGILIKKCMKQGSMNTYNNRETRELFRFEDKIYVAFDDYDTNKGDFREDSEQTELHILKLNGKAYRKPLIFKNQELGDMIPDGEGGVYLLNFKRSYVRDPFYRNTMFAHHVDNKFKRTWGSDGIRFQPERYVLNFSLCCHYTKKDGLKLLWTSYTKDQNDFKIEANRIDAEGELSDGADGRVLLEADSWMDIRSRIYDPVTGDLLTLIYQHNENDGFFNYLNISALLFKGDIEAEEEEEDDEEDDETEEE